MKKPSGQSKGFTLIELLVYLGLVVLAVTIFSTFIIDVTKHTTMAEAKQEIQQDARFLLSRMTQEIRTASAATVTPNGEKIVLTKNPVTTFYWENSKIYYDDTSGPVPLSSDKVSVSQLRFGKNADSISISLTVERQSSNGNNQIELNSTVVPRALIY